MCQGDGSIKSQHADHIILLGFALFDYIFIIERGNFSSAELCQTFSQDLALHCCLCTHSHGSAVWWKPHYLKINNLSRTLKPGSEERDASLKSNPDVGKRRVSRCCSAAKYSLMLHHWSAAMRTNRREGSSLWQLGSGGVASHQSAGDGCAGACLRHPQDVFGEDRLDRSFNSEVSPLTVNDLTSPPCCSQPLEPLGLGDVVLSKGHPPLRLSNDLSRCHVQIWTTTLALVSRIISLTRSLSWTQSFFVSFHASNSKHPQICDFYYPHWHKPRDGNPSTHWWCITSVQTEILDTLS